MRTARKLTITAEVTQGRHLASSFHIGAGTPVERSTYNVELDVYLPESMTLEDVHHALVRFRDSLQAVPA